MKAQGRQLLTRVALVAGVGAVALLGEMRSSTSLAASPVVPNHGESYCTTADASTRLGATTSRLKVGFGETGQAVGTVADTEDASLVPAIYSWNPDVRFVYYRHVSKWM